MTADRPPASGEPSTLRFLYDAAATIYDWDDSGNGVPSDDAWKRLEEALQEAHEALEALAAGGRTDHLSSSRHLGSRA